MSHQTISSISPLLCDPIDAWLDYLAKNLNYSNKTCIAYRHDMINFIRFIAQYKATSLRLKDILNLSLQTFEAFLEHRKRHDLMTHRSLVRNLSAIKSFFHYHERDTQQKNEALAHLNVRFKNRKLPKPIDQADIMDILDYMQYQSHHEDWVKKRNYALSLLLYGCGLRISEALSISQSHYSSTYQSLTIQGKGQKIRHLPLLTCVIKALEAYIKACPFRLGLNDALFRGVRGKPLAGYVFYKTLQEAYHYLDIPYHFSAHSFRHSCASHLLEQGADLRNIQSLMGHEKLSSTEHYLKVNSDHLRKIIAKSHPKR